MLDRPYDELPPIARARGWRLYATNGKRYLDLCSDGGRLILGARPAGLGRLVKEMLDRGLVARAAPSRYGGRLSSALKRRFGASVAFALYASEREARAALSGREHAEWRPFDPSCAGGGSSPFALTGAELVLLRLPLARDLSPGVVMGPGAGSLYPGAAPSPLKAACAAWSLDLLADFALSYGESAWARADPFVGARFERRGPWLFPRLSGTEYAAFARSCLEAGIIVNPDPAEPSLLPGEWTEGELKPILSL